MGGNLYENCHGTGIPVSKVIFPSDKVGPGRVGANGTGLCSVCGREVSQRGEIASRHADKRDIGTSTAPHSADGNSGR